MFRPKANAGVIIYRINGAKLEILLVHQTDKRKNLWSIPKGGIKANETLEDAAMREVQEETNARLTSLEFLGYTDYTKTNKRLYCFSSSFPPDAQLKANSREIDGIKFVSIAQAKKMVEKNQREMINTFQKILIFSTRRNKSSA